MRIKEISLATADLGKVEAFYSEVLQLPLVHREPGRLSFAVGYSVIHFTNEKAPAGIYHFAFLIPPQLLEPSYQWIKSRIPVLPFSEQSDIADFTNWNARAFYFHDEEQNILEFIAHYDMEQGSESAFEPHNIIGVGEIGIGVEDVTLACNKLHTIYNIPYYHKGPFLPSFAVMGEEEGLLIISAIGRGWLPTGQLAANSSVHIILDMHGELINIDC